MKRQVTLKSNREQFTNTFAFRKFSIFNFQFSITLCAKSAIILTVALFGGVKGLAQTDKTADRNLNNKQYSNFMQSLSDEIVSQQQPLAVKNGNQREDDDECLIDEFPYVQDFDGNGFNLPVCWTQEYVVNSVNWVINDGNAGYPSYSHSGKYLARFKNTSYHNPDVTKLIMPAMDLTALQSPAVLFWYVQDHNSYVYEQDELRVFYKTSLDGEWILLKEFTQNIKTWTQEMIFLPEPSSDYYVAFEGTGKRGRGLVLDDIMISEGQKFIELVAIKSPPVIGINLTEAEPVKVLLKNKGCEPIDECQLILEFNGEEVAVENLTEIIPVAGQMLYTFAHTLDLSAEAEYNVKVTVITPSNVDEQSITGRNSIVDVINTFPWEEGFEDNGTAFPDGWRQEYVKGTCNWNVTVPGAWYLPTSHSGEYVAALRYDYGGNNITKLIPPPLDLSELTYPTLKFWRKLGSGLCNLRIYYKSHIADEWSLLSEYEGYDAQWQDTLVELPNPSKTYFISFEGQYNSDAVTAIDDITIFDGEPRYEAEFVEIITDLDAGTFTAVIKNNGFCNIPTLKVAYKLNDAAPVIEEFEANLPFKDTIYHTFDYILSQGYYYLEAYIIMDEDYNHTNDTTRRDIIMQPDLRLYGYRVYGVNSAPIGFVSFTTRNPQEVSFLNDYTDEGFALASGTIVGDKLYAYTANRNPLGAKLRKYVVFSVNDWSLQFEAPIHDDFKNVFHTDITYDITTNTIYAASAKDNWPAPHEYMIMTINPQTGVPTNVATQDMQFSFIACNLQGELYSIGANGMLYKFDKTTYSYTEIGSSGYDPKFRQTMTFDLSSGRLLWAFHSAQMGLLLEVDLTTGRAYNHGTIGLGTGDEINAIHTIYNPSAIKENVLSDIVIYSYKNTIYIDNEIPIKSVEIFDVTGRIVYQNKADISNEINLNVTTGIYVVRVLAETGKIYNAKLKIEN
jgi:hypothetical protein